MGIGVVIGARTGAGAGQRIGAGRGTAATSTTHTVSVADSADPVITGGDAFAYTVQYTNTGSIPATSVSIAVTLDASLSYVSSSGTGWSFAVAGQVVTCTRATAGVGAAPAITINVTTGGSALTASTTAAATAGNAPGANGSQTTTVQLVSKDATSGIYVPSSTTEWTNFIARKGLGIQPPTSLYLCQEASGNLTDSIGGFTGTAAGTIAYQQAMTGWSRKCVKFTDGNTTGQFSSTAVANVVSNSWFRLALVGFTAPATTTKNMWLIGTSAFLAGTGNTNGTIYIVENGNQALSVNTYSGQTVLLGGMFDRGGSRNVGYTQTEKMVGTYNASPTGAKMTIGVGSNTNGPYGFGYVADWSGVNAQMSDAQVKALYQALGYTISWT